MNYKFLKSTLRFGFGISLLMTLVACPAEPDSSEGSGNSDESRKSHPTESYNLFNYSRYAVIDYNSTAQLFDRINNPLCGELSFLKELQYAFNDLFFSVPYYHGTPKKQITLKGPVRFIAQQSKTRFEDRETTYSFDENSSLVKLDYVKINGKNAGHYICSYDENGNLIQKSVFDKLGNFEYQTGIEYTYNSNNEILSMTITLAGDTTIYTYIKAEEHINGYPKTINTFANDELVQILKFDIEGRQTLDSIQVCIGCDEWDTYATIYDSGVSIRKENKNNFFFETQSFFNKEKQLTKVISFRNDSLVGEEIYEYDKVGRISKAIMQYDKMTFDLVAEFTYDTKGNIIELKNSYYVGNKLDHCDLLSFKFYDSYGNPTLFTFYEDDILQEVYERKIEYYE
ncbi:MAG: hypothetical protein ACPGYF_02615 [Chitinophagales bacterium]